MYVCQIYEVVLRAACSLRVDTVLSRLFDRLIAVEEVDGDARGVM